MSLLLLFCQANNIPILDIEINDDLPDEPDIPFDINSLDTWNFDTSLPKPKRALRANNRKPVIQEISNKTGLTILIGKNKPPAAELNFLYEHYSAKEIGEMYNREKSSVLRWLKYYNIPIKPIGCRGPGKKHLKELKCVLND